MRKSRTVSLNGYFHNEKSEKDSSFNLQIKLFLIDSNLKIGIVSIDHDLRIIYPEFQGAKLNIAMTIGQ